MKTKFFVVAATLSCLIISCRKDVLPPDIARVKSEVTIQKLKSFYQQEVHSSGFKESITPDQGIPDWEQTISLNGRYLVPVTVNTHKPGNKYNVSKYLLLTETGNHIKGQYVYCVNNKSTGTHAPGLREILSQLNDNNSGTQKAGNRPVFAITGIKQLSADFLKGNTIQYKIAQPSAKAGDTIIVANNLPAANCEENGGTLVEIEWWYQEYDNYGNLIFEEYVYSTYECWGIGSGGGGGGTTPTPQQLCAIKLDNFVAQGSPVSELRSTVTTYEDAAGINVTYSWKIFSALTWGLISYEDAVISKIPLPRGGYIKEYSSFTHRLITDIGVSIGGTRTYQDLGATINKAQTKAQVRIDFKVTHTPTGCIPNVAMLYNANKEFSIVNNIAIE